MSLNAYLYTTDSIQERMMNGSKEAIAVRLKNIEAHLTELDKDIAGKSAASQEI